MKALHYGENGITPIEYDSPLGDMMEGCYMQLTAGRNTVVTIPEGLDPMMDKLERALQLSIGRRYAAITLKAAPRTRT